MAQPNQEASNTTPQPKSRSGSILAIFSLVIAIAAIVIAGVVYQQLIITKSRITTATQASSFTQKNVDEHIDRFRQEIATIQQKNKTNLSQLLKQTANIPAQQALSQAKYLIHLANLNLQYRGDVNTAKEQLSLALQQLQAFHTPQVESLKGKISQDLETLDKTKSINQQQLLNDLDTLIQEIKQIPILPTSPHTATNSKQPSTQTNWWSKVKGNLGKFKSFVSIQHINNPNAYAFTPEEKMLTKQLILVKLTQAQWAVINLDQGVYQQSLSATQKMLANISLPADTKQTIEKQLSALAQTTLTLKTNIALPTQKTEKPNQGTQ